MAVTIDTVPLGPDNTYLVRDQGAILIDGGSPKKSQAFVKAMEKISFNPEDIRLMVMTHGHFDHIGSAAAIKEITGASVAMHEKEKDWLEKGLKNAPPGLSAWGSILVGLMKVFIVPFVTIPTAPVDIVLDNNVFSLEDYGIPGRIIHTPGHSPGSISVLLETGEAFVGDLAINALPMRLTPGLSEYGDSIDTIKESWRTLLDQGAKMIYPAHGAPFPVEVIEKTLTKRG